MIRLFAILTLCSSIPTLLEGACSENGNVGSPIVPPEREEMPGNLIAKGNELVIFPEREEVSQNVNEQVDCPFNEDGLLDWDDPSVWGGSVPAANPEQPVNIPAGVKILISHCSLEEGVYGQINIPASSQLIFNDEDMELKTVGIQVLGKLVVGTSSCRLRSKVTITLHGDRNTSPPSFAYKGIDASEGGTIDMHGQFQKYTWSRLASTADVSSTTIYLQDAVDWQVGQEIVIVATEYKDSRDFNHNEQRTIQGISTDGSFTKIILNSPLQYTHLSGTQYQGEVGLLTRNVKVQGDEGSEPQDTDNDVCSDNFYSSYPCPDKHLTGFGGHIVARGQNSALRVSGVEAYRMGQLNVLGRYPFHMHLQYEGGINSYVKDSSIHRSFFRCVTIHRSHKALVTNNVAFDAIGHCYYMEDGLEEENIISFNLAAHVHFLGYPARSNNQFQNEVVANANLLNPADITASGFYISNVYNRVFGNAAAGGYSGFAFPRFDAPLNGQEGEPAPSKRPSLEFNGNSCHSSGFWWDPAACIYVGGTLRERSETDKTLIYDAGRDDGQTRDTRCEDGSPCWLKFTNTKVFLSGYGINHWGTRGEIISLEVYDAIRPVAVLGQQLLQNFLIECRTGFQPSSPGNKYQEQRWYYGYVGFEWYDTHQYHIVTDGVFRNCGDKDSRSYIWKSISHSDQFVPEAMQTTSKIRYENCDLDMLFGFTHTDYLSLSGNLTNWYDSDGSAFGRPNPVIAGSARGNEWWKLDDNCSVITYGYSDDPGFWVCDAVAPRTGSRRHIGSILMIPEPNFPGQIGQTYCSNGNYNNVPCPRIGYAQHFGASDESMVPLTPNTYLTGPVNGLGWLLVFDKGSPVNLRIEHIQMFEGDVMTLVLPYPKDTTFEIKMGASQWCNTAWSTCEEPFLQVDSMGDMLDGPLNTFYFDTNEGLLFLRVPLQNEHFLDFSGGPSNLDDRSFTRNNISVAFIGWHSNMEIKASCTLNPNDANYCQYSYQGGLAKKPCSYFGLEGELEGYDQCVTAAVLTGSPVPVPTSSIPTTDEDSRDEEESEGLNTRTIVTAAAVCGFVMLAAIASIVISKRRNSHRVTTGLAAKPESVF